jgi:hypothetical protein
MRLAATLAALLLSACAPQTPAQQSVSMTDHIVEWFSSQRAASTPMPLPRVEPTPVRIEPARPARKHKAKRRAKKTTRSAEPRAIVSPRDCARLRWAESILTPDLLKEESRRRGFTDQQLRQAQSACHAGAKP